MLELIHAFPDPEVVIALSSEELGLGLLPHLITRAAQQSNGLLHIGNLCNEVEDISRSRSQYAQAGNYKPEHVNDVKQALVEAWAWLESQCLVVPCTDQNNSSGWRRLSRRAHTLVKQGGAQEYLSSKLLPKELVHQSIRDKVWMAFIRGEYDNAVLQAMKQVEVSVREACSYGDNVLGVDLMRKAFNVDNGPLTDISLERGEREARQHFFAGALGSYKNPQSHRHVNLDDPIEAIEQVILASHLLRIVDSRAAERAKAS